MGDPPPVNIAFPVGKNKLHFRIPADALTGNHSYSYRTEPSAEEGKRLAIFQIKRDDVIVYQNKSSPFPSGSFEQVKANRKSKDDIHLYQVKVSNPKKLKLNDYFDA